MKTDLLVDDLLASSNFRTKIEKVEACEANFSLLTSTLGLDKTKDFRFSNLRNIDITDTDLRGFDFTGSDLRGAFGSSFIVDDSTILVNAQLAGSIFEAIEKERRLFQTVPTSRRLYDALVSGDPYSTSDWIFNKYSDGLPRKYWDGIQKEHAKILCQKLLTEDIDITKRTNLLIMLREFCESPDELLSILMNMFSRHSEDASVVLPFLSAATRLFREDISLIQIITPLCTHANLRIRLAALVAMSHTKMSASEFKAFSNLVFDETNVSLRKQVLRNAALKLGRAHALAINTSGATEEIRLSAVLDFSLLLEERYIEKVRLSQKWRSSVQTMEEIREKQQEVMVASALFDTVLRRRALSWYIKAKNRLRHLRQ